MSKNNTKNALKKKEVIEHPNRYVKNGIEVWEIEKAFAAPAEKNIPHFVEHLRFGALEYLLRMYEKNGVEDVKKARFLCDRIIKELEGKDNANE